MHPVHPYQNFLAVLSHPPYKMLNLGKKIVDTHVQSCLRGGGGGGGGLGEGLGMCDLKKAPQIMQKRPKTYVHDGRP